MMRPTLRSMSGVILMLAIVPFVIGLLACMPVPIGNPERSRIVPETSGIWFATNEGEEAFYAFEPWDKRTWIVTGVAAGEIDEAPSLLVYKAWRSKHGGEWFMTWEPRINYDDEAFQPEMWIVFREERPDPDRLLLHMVNGDHDVFKGLDKTRRAYEKVLRKNVKNPEIYPDEPWAFTKASPEQVSLFYSAVDRVIDSN